MVSKCLAALIRPQEIQNYLPELTVRVNVFPSVTGEFIFGTIHGLCGRDKMLQPPFNTS